MTEQSVTSDQTTDEEALDRSELMEARSPTVGEGTPQTAPERPVPSTLIDRVRSLLT